MSINCCSVMQLEILCRSAAEIRGFPIDAKEISLKKEKSFYLAISRFFPFFFFSSRDWKSEFFFNDNSSRRESKIFREDQY